MKERLSEKTTGCGQRRSKNIKNPHPASQLHADQTNNKLYLYEKTNTTNKKLQMIIAPLLLSVLK